MADRISKEERSVLMSRVRARGNASTELAVMHLLQRLDLRGWRRHLKLGVGESRNVKKVASRPDFVFRKRRIAIFVHGCFWHGCPKHGTLPKTRTLWWAEKISANIIRDRATEEALKKLGWRVIIIWEHELRRGEHGVETKLVRAFDDASQISP